MSLDSSSAVSRPPWPSAWPGPITPRQVGGCVFVFALTAFLIATGAGAIATGDPRGPLIALGVPVMAALTVQVLVTQLHGRRHAPLAIKMAEVPQVERVGVVVRYSGVLALAHLALWITLSLSMLALLVAFGAAALSGFPRYWTAALPMVVIAPLTVYLLLLLVHIAMGRMRRGLLALTPEGIYHRAWAYEASVPWDAVVAVWPGYGFRPAGPHVSVTVASGPDVWFRQTSRLWRQPGYQLRPHLELPCVEFPVDPAVLLHAVQYYAEHPAQRVELGDDRGVQRIRTGSFP